MTWVERDLKIHQVSTPQPNGRSGITWVGKRKAMLYYWICLLDKEDLNSNGWLIFYMKGRCWLAVCILLFCLFSSNYLAGRNLTYVIIRKWIFILPSILIPIFPGKAQFLLLRMYKLLQILIQRLLKIAVSGSLKLFVCLINEISMRRGIRKRKSCWCQPRDQKSSSYLKTTAPNHITEAR